jgi:hypothetical protein
MIRRLIPDYEFVENMSRKLFKEFINTPDGLPHDLMSIIREFVPEINSIRSEVCIDHPEFIDMDREERAIAYKMRSNPDYKIDDALDFHTQYALDFLEKYPQFKPMIKGVEVVKP